MLDGIGKDFGLSLAVFLSILLTAEHDGLCAIDLVDAVNNGIQSFIFSNCSAFMSNRSCWMGLFGPIPITITPAFL